MNAQQIIVAAEAEATVTAKLDTRIGECKALTCRAGCTDFVLDSKAGAFNLCACGHTQNSHAVPGEQAAVRAARRGGR